MRKRRGSPAVLRCHRLTATLLLATVLSVGRDVVQPKRPRGDPTPDRLRQATAPISINIHSNMGPFRAQPPAHYRA